MARTVKVALQAEVGQYKRGMGEAERATDKLADAIDGIDGKPLDDAAAKAKGLGDSIGESADRAARDFGAIGSHAKELDRKIKDTESGMRSLAKAFAETGDPKILAAWKEQGRVLGELRNVRKFVPDPAETLNFGRRLGDGITKAVPPQLAQALIAGGIAASPFLAATLVGAVTGGAGLMGIGGGLALALRDPKIKAEAKNLGAFIDSQMRDSFGAFGPATIRSLGIVRTKIAELRDEFDRIGDNSASQLVPLATSVAKAVGDIIEGLDRVIGRSGPTLQVIGDGIEGIGEQVEMFLNMVASNSDAGAKALQDLFTIIEFGLRSLTFTVDMLAKAYKFGTAWTTLIPGMSGASEDLAGANGKAGESTGILGKAVEETGKKVELASHKFVALNEQIQAIVDRNLSAAEANIAMRSAVKSLTDAIDKKAAVTDDERTALISYARTTNSATKALDEQGRTVGEATRAHETNRKKLIETAIRMGYTRAEAKKLASQYLATPKNVTTRVEQPGMAKSRADTKKYHDELDDVTRKIRTAVSVEGADAAYAKLKTLLVAQQAAKKGISISAANSAFNKNAKGFHDGGYTGNVGTREPAGVVHGKEWVIKADSTAKIQRKAPGLLEEMNATGQVPGYVRGGLVMPFRVNASMTKVISMAEALSKVAPSFGNWPSSPSAQRGDSGVWRKVLQLIKSGPKMGSFGNAYRPGDPKWHGSGRAIDWMGYNMDPLARYLAAKRPLELIHRTRTRDYAYTRGRNKGSFNNALMNAHRNHIHIAMGSGGVIPEHVVGVGSSGNTYEFGERGPERVLSAGQTAAGAGAGRVITMTLAPVFHINGSNLSAAQIVAQADRQIGAQFNQLVRGIS